MRKQKLPIVTGFLLTGLCLFYGSNAVAGSVPIVGTTGTNSTYIVVPEEYEGKEGQFVATATSSNKNYISYGEPYFSGYLPCMEVTHTTYKDLEIVFETPSGEIIVTGNYPIGSLAKGSYPISVRQQKVDTTICYSIPMDNWEGANLLLEDLRYYVQNGTYPQYTTIAQPPQCEEVEKKQQYITTGLTLASAYIVVYGVEDKIVKIEEVSEDSITVNVLPPETDDGVYTLITSLFGYISEMQTILNASDDAIHEELSRYIMELRNDYQQADSQLAVSVQNQINVLDNALSTDIATLRNSLEREIASLQGQISGLQTQQNALLEEFYSLKTELQTAIQNNTSDIGKLSEELREKYDALVNANVTLKADLLKEIAEVSEAYKEADEALISDYSSKLSALQTLMYEADANLENNIKNLQSAYLTADLQLKENLELQMTNLQNQLSDSDRQLLQEISALETAMGNADATLQADYTNRIATLEQGLSSEAATLRAEINNLQKNYQTANAQLKENLELQMSNLQNQLSDSDQQLLQEISALETAMNNANEALETDYTNKIASLSQKLTSDGAALQAEINNLQQAYLTADQLQKENLELQLANLRNQLSDSDKQLLQEISALETAMNNADDSLKADYTNKVAALEQHLSSEGSALRTEMDNLQKNYQTEISYLKENLELQIKSLKDQTQTVTTDLQKQIDSLNNHFAKEIAELTSKYDAELAELTARSETTDAELRTAMEAYVIALQQQMKDADNQLKADLQGQLDNLSGAFDERLKMVIAEYEQRIDAIRKSINDLENNTKTNLVTQKALLEQECTSKITALQKEYADRISKSGNPEKLKAELSAKISEINLEYRKQILEIEKTLAGLSEKTASELQAELTELQSKKDMAESALANSDYNEKLSMIVQGGQDNANDAHADLKAKLAQLERELAALTELGNLSIEDVIAKIKAGDTANAEEMKNLEIALKLYCDSVKNALNERIASLENTISVLQNTLQQRMQTLENRLAYSVMTDEELADLEKSKNESVNSLANQIAGLQLAIKDAKEKGEDTSALDTQLSSLTVEYGNAQNDLENIRYVIELRGTSELALHRKWIKELQELTASLQMTVNKQGETIEQQKSEIEGLKTTIANLEKALQSEIKNLEDTLKNYVDDNVTELNAAAEKMKTELETLRDNIVTLATSAYSGYNSSTTGNGGSYNYSGANKDTVEDDRDLRTSDDTALDF